MKLVSPLQEVIEVAGSLEDFAKENDLNFYKLMRMIEGYTRTYLGWRNYSKIDKVVDPEGNVLEILGTKKDFAKANGLTVSGLSILTVQKRGYMNWQPYIEENDYV